MFDQNIMSEAIALAKEHKEYLHNVPESAFEEHKTTTYIKGICGRYPVEMIDSGMETGLVC